MSGATVTHTVAFADGPGGGNPCPVVRGADGWSAAQMQAAAAAFGHETCFVLDGDAGAGAGPRLRYFVPRHEMEMCVHATVAASVLLGLSDGAMVQTALGPRRVGRRDDGGVVVEQSAPVVGPAVDDLDALTAALGAAPSGEVRSVSTARAKLLVPLVDEGVLDGLAPDFAALWSLCDDLGTTGVYAYTLDARNADVAARQFPVRAGYDEDPATGVAACALGAWLAREPEWNRLRIAQGRALGRPSLIDAEALVRDGAVVATRVGGHAAVLGDPEPLARP